MNARWLVAIPVAVVLLSSAAPGSAQDGEPREPLLSSFQIYWENDSFLRSDTSDESYTNGTKIAWMYNRSRPGYHEPDWIDPLFAAWCQTHLCNDGQVEFGYGHALGQNLYTPEVIVDPNPQPYDRPWAAYLYYSWFVQATYFKTETQWPVQNISSSRWGSSGRVRAGGTPSPRCTRSSTVRSPRAGATRSATSRRSISSTSGGRRSVTGRWTSCPTSGSASATSRPTAKWVGRCGSATTCRAFPRTSSRPGLRRRRKSLPNPSKLSSSSAARHAESPTTSSSTGTPGERPRDLDRPQRLRLRSQGGSRRPLQGLADRLHGRPGEQRVRRATGRQGRTPQVRSLRPELEPLERPAVGASHSFRLGAPIGQIPRKVAGTFRLEAGSAAGEASSTALR